jgi:hypothetical protein
MRKRRPKTLRSKFIETRNSVGLRLPECGFVNRLSGLLRRVPWDEGFDDAEHVLSNGRRKLWPPLKHRCELRIGGKQSKRQGQFCCKVLSFQHLAKGVGGL